MTDKPAQPTEDETHLDNEGDEATAPPPEPWTPERVREWNAYYDVYVAAFVLALVFLVSSNYLTPDNSVLWNLLQTGRRIVATGSPLGLDGETTASTGRRWVNIPWLFELANYGIYQGVTQAFPPDLATPAPPSGTTPQGEKVGIGVLIALAALIRAGTAFLLLGLRHRQGPGLWWVALCVALAMGVTIGPAPVTYLEAVAQGEAPRVGLRAEAGIQLGGIAGVRSVPSVSPAAWGLFFLALELVLIHQTLTGGRRARAWALIPLFLVWANLDESFALGLIVLALATLGQRFDAPRLAGAKPGGADRTSADAQAPLGSILGASVGVCLLNPSHVFGVLGGFAPILRSLGIADGVPTSLPVGLFGKRLELATSPAFASATRWYHLAWIGVGLLSFLLNRARFSWSRLLIFAGISTLWVTMTSPIDGPFAVALAATLALNGQEWYQATMGTAGRLGAGWVVWSTGGRLLTIGLVALAIFQTTTGWGSQPGDTRFGFGFNPDDFPFESVDTLADAKITGNVLNTTAAQGDALTWRTLGKRRAYLDSKAHLYDQADYEKFRTLRLAIRDEKLAEWQPILDEANVSVMLLEPTDAPTTYTRLMSSKNWIPFLDDGTVVMFGRADAHANATDLAYFREHRLDAAELAYKRPRDVPAWNGVPQPVSEMVDRIFANRLLTRTQPHVAAAQRWLRPATVPAGSNYLPDPAQCLLAIRELRAALSANANDFAAYRLLIEAYRLLLQQESALLAGVTITPETIASVLRVQPQFRPLPNRTRQLLTAFNFALQTMPPAKSAADREERARLNFDLAQIELQVGYADLARDRLKAIVDMRSPVGELDEPLVREVARRLGELNQGVGRIQNQLSDLTIQRRASPQQKADFARNSGTPGLAIRELEEADQSGGVQGVRPLLVDLYCETGQPDQALNLIATLSIDDPSLSTGIGTATHRQGLIYYLLGDDRNAEALWGEQAIPQIRSQRLIQPVEATRGFLQGQITPATRSFLELPERVATQAQWEFELGMAGLEGGRPSGPIADHLRLALELEPNLTVRPVIAYYLTQLGQAVPPLRADSGPLPRKTTNPPIEPAAELPSDPFEAPR